jgi:hypothetical protein
MPVLMEIRPVHPANQDELLGSLSGWSVSYDLIEQPSGVQETVDSPAGTELLHPEDIAILALVGSVSGVDENPPRSTDYDEDE